MAPLHPGRRSSSAMMPMHALGHMHNLNQSSPDPIQRPPAPPPPLHIQSHEGCEQQTSPFIIPGTNTSVQAPLGFRVYR